MRLTQVDLNLFLVFNAIYSEQSLTKASKILCITQPAVSNALSRLRTTFNDPLFIRTMGSMHPTPFAKNIIEDVREALQLFACSIEEGHKFDPSESKIQINCSMNDLAESLFLPAIIKYLQRYAPAITFNSYYVSRDKVTKELAAGTLDFAIDIPFSTDKNIFNKTLSGEEHVCVVRKNHPIIVDELSLQDYINLGHIHVSNRRKGQGAVDIALNKLGYQRNIKVRVKHYMVAIKLIENSDLLWTIPKRLAIQFNLNYFALPIDMPAVVWHLLWHKNANKDQANVWLRELFFKLINNS